METFSSLLALYRGIHRSPVDSPHKARDCINDWANSPDAGDFKSHATYFDVTVMEFEKLFCWFDRSIIITVGQRKKVTAVTFFPARPRADQRGTNTGQIRKVALYEIAWFLVYRMSSGDMAVYSFAGKEVTAVSANRGEGGYWRRGRRLLCLCWNWIALSFLKHWE